MMVPDYLKEPSLEGHIYGNLTFSTETKLFRLTGEPLLLAYAKRIFPGARVTRGGGGYLEFHRTRREVADLNWLMMRFPVNIDQCRSVLKSARDEAIVQINSRVSGDDRRKTKPPADFLGKLYGYQESAVTFLTSNSRCVLGDGMGCIDGDAVVRVNRAGKGFRVRLEDAYKRFHGLDGGHSWDPSIQTMATSLCDGELRLNRVVDILDKGVRGVVRLVLMSGKVLRLTPDHELLTPCGDVEVQRLNPGDVVFSNGKQCCPMCGSAENLITYRYSKFLGVCKKCMYGKLRSKPSWTGGKFIDNDGYVRCSGNQEHPRANASGQVYEHILVMEQHLGRRVSLKEVIHHKNGDGSNNRLDNLELLTVGEHHVKHKRHLNLNTGKNVMFIPVQDEVVSIEEDGTAHVYDIVMDDPHRNFVANGVVVHNCGKTWSGLGAAAAANDYPVLIVCQTHVQRQWQRMIGMLFDLPGLKGQRDMSPFELSTKRGEALAPILTTQSPYRIPGTPFAIIHYGLLGWWEKTLLRREFKTVIFDEVQELRHTGTLKYSAASLISEAALNVWGLSGTPVYGYGSEIWSVMNAIDFHCLGSEEAFTREWCTGYGERIVSDPKALNGHLSREGLLLRRRFTDDEVMIDIPKVVRKVEDLHHDELLYDKLIGATYDKAQRYRRARFTEKGRLARMIEQESRRATGVAKAEYVAEFVASLVESGERPLVYAWHHDVHDIYQERLKEFKPAIFTGKQTVSQKDAHLRRYMDGETPLALLSLRSAAGLDGLQYRATMCVFGELDWSPAIHGQAETRIARIGVDASIMDVPSYYCVASVGHDEAMLDVLGVKTGQFVGLMGDEPESYEEKQESEKRATKRIEVLVDKLKTEQGQFRPRVKVDNPARLLGVLGGRLRNGKGAD